MRPFVLVAALVWTLAAGGALAARPAVQLPDRIRLVAETRPAAGKPLGAVLKAIGERHPGRALDARLTEQGGRPLYRIKWLGDDGKVREVIADARTGQILRIR